MYKISKDRTTRNINTKEQITEENLGKENNLRNRIKERKLIFNLFKIIFKYNELSTY